MVVAIVVNVDWFFLSHRLPIALTARERGYKVFIITRNTGKFDTIRDLGLNPIHLEIERSGKNILKELKVVKRLGEIYKCIKPDVVHHVTLKVAIYGSIAAKHAHVGRIINAISGLGYNFSQTSPSIVQKLIVGMMRYAFKGAPQTFIFQNPDDSRIFENLNLLQKNTYVIIKGSGVDLDMYQFREPCSKDKVQFILPARMLRDKGVREFVKAAIVVNRAYPGKGEWLLVGNLDEDNPAGFKERELKELIDCSPVNWIGFQRDILSILYRSHVVVLPSYREGLPKSLIEAAAVGRPIITTDTAGCRECVDDGVNGFLVPVGDDQILAERMIELLLDASLRKKMGQQSRKKAEMEFSIKKVVSETLQLYVSR